MELLTWIRAQWDRCAAWVLIVAGGVVLILGWVGVSRYAYPADQLPYIISGGIGGLLLVGVGAMLWLSADLRDEWRMLRRIDEAIRDQAGVALVVDDRSGDGDRRPPRRGEPTDIDLSDDENARAAEAPTAEHEVYVDPAPALVPASAAAPARRSPKPSSTARATKRNAPTKPSTGERPSGRNRPAPRVAKPLSPDQ